MTFGLFLALGSGMDQMVMDLHLFVTHLVHLFCLCRWRELRGATARTRSPRAVEAAAFPVANTNADPGVM
ncbi:hypothetical protein Z043_110317 [Scleropages formosus]|uniref:Uncharacterized protein n=1 Tax=Scleropages formosus TaxID=113540 RepID=A0A0P7UMS6_SCLFO|nr:hypothetical protein Z043_110317 [Scleropages formosus]